MLPKDGEKVSTKYAEPMVGGGALFFSILSKYDFEELYRQGDLKDNRNDDNAKER